GPGFEVLPGLTHRRPRIWLRDVDRLDTLLATYGDEAGRSAFTRGLAHQAIGAEYLAHFLADVITTPAPITGDSTGRPDDRLSVLGHPGGSMAGEEQLPLYPPSALAP